MKYIKNNIVFILLLFACTGNQKSESENLVYKTTSDTISTRSSSLNDDYSDTCSIEYFLNAPEIHDLSKSFWQGEFRPSDDQPTQSILNNLETSNKKHLPFYILVVDKINKMADGALTEMTIYATRDLVENKTLEFFNFFNDPHCLSKKHLKTPHSFAQQYAYYLGMHCDNEESEENFEDCVKGAIITLQSKCKDCEMEQFISVIEYELLN